MNKEESDREMEIESEVTNADLVKFLTAMQVNAEKMNTELRGEIKSSKDTIEKQIKAGNEQVKAELRSLNSKIDEVKGETEMLKIDNEKIKVQIMKTNDENVGRFSKMEARFKQFEVEKKKLLEEETKRKELRKKLVDKEAEKHVDKPDMTIPAIQPEGTSYAARTKTKDSQDKEVVEELKFKSTWARQVSQVSLEKQLEMATKAAERMEAMGGDGGHVSRPKARKKDLKMGDSLHNEKDWGWGDSDHDWDGVEDKVRKNAEKKRKENMKKNKRR